MSEIARLRPSPIAGQWYEGNPTTLRRKVTGWLTHKPIKPAGRVVGVIAPHAGHIYSGSVAGTAFGCLVGQVFDLVIILSPYHDYTTTPLLTSAHQAYWTPLGEVPIATDKVAAVSAALIENGDDPLASVANDREHSLEIELPFLQVALAQPFSLLPIMAQTHQPRLLQTLAKAIANVCATQSTLLVASSDLSHFYPDAIANQLDGEMLRRMQSFDPQAVLDGEVSGTAFACGAGPMAAVLWAAKHLGANQVEIVDYATSAAATGDTRRVVGYGAALITASREGSKG